MYHNNVLIFQFNFVPVCFRCEKKIVKHQENSKHNQIKNLNFTRNHIEFTLKLNRNVFLYVCKTHESSESGIQFQNFIHNKKNGYKITNES